MYKNFYGLDQIPFGLTPNTSLYYGLPPHEEALEVLKTALESGEGIIKVTGEVGTGKTMVLRLFLSQLSDNIELIYIPNPVLSPSELKLTLARELELSYDSSNLFALSDDINKKLLELNKAQKKVLMVIDEAQALPDETLEAIRLLGNLETEYDKMIQIVLFGQPELDLQLAKPNLRQLRQRISFSYGLRPLNSDEVYAYLNYRMSCAGYDGREIFSRKIATRIQKSCNGIPRLINIVANKCLLLAYGYGERFITKKMLSEALTDTVINPNKSLILNWTNIGLLFLIIIILVLSFALCI